MNVTYAPVAPATTFTLEQNRIHVGANRLLLFFLIVFFPVLLTAFIGYNFLPISEVGFTVLVSSVAALSIGGYGLMIAKKDTTTHSLVVQAGIIRFDNSNITYTTHKNSLSIKLINWGVKHNPAIKITGQNFPCITIGTLEKNKQDQKREECIDCTNYIVSTKDMKALLLTLDVK